MDVVTARSYRRQQTEAYRRLLPIPTDPEARSEEWSTAAWAAVDSFEAARQRYEAAVRELFSSGVPVPQLAEKLGVPEREIRWITETRSCAFCGRRQRDGAVLSGGADHDICQECLTAAAAGSGRASGAAVQCSFCKKPKAELALTAPTGQSICHDCVAFAEECLAD